MTHYRAVSGVGRLVGLAVVAMDLGGVEMVLQGVQVIRRDDGLLTVRSPVWRDPMSQEWVPAVVLDDVLTAAIAREVVKLVWQNTPGGQG